MFRKRKKLPTRAEWRRYNRGRELTGSRVHGQEADFASNISRFLSRYLSTSEVESVTQQIVGDDGYDHLLIVSAGDDDQLASCFVGDLLIAQADLRRENWVQSALKLSVDDGKPPLMAAKHDELFRPHASEVVIIPHTPALNVGHWIATVGMVPVIVPAHAMRALVASGEATIHPRNGNPDFIATRPIQVNARANA